ncbi:MAG: Rab family GTPase [Campylobacterota bacterium]|nr:Rab family GTPase [Campylobacterota bacterium]
MLAYKVVMVGDFGVGKTSLVQRFVENSFSEEYLSTIGVSISKKRLENSTIMLWDIEGHTEFKPIFKQYLLGAKGFIVVADINRANTIESIKNHVELCHTIVKDAPICIALNKCDLEHTLSEDDMQELKSISDLVVNILKTSAKEGDAVNEIFGSLDDFIVHSLGT